MISIHAPRAGRDSRPALPGGVVRAISIHAPRAGRDYRHGAEHFREITFQSTRPVRGATQLFHLRFWIALKISIHAPRAGRDYIISDIALAI